MTNHTFTELTDRQMETVSGGHCHHHHHHHSRGGRGMMGGLQGLIKGLGGLASNANISIIIIANSTINAPVQISVNQGIS